MRDRRRKRFLEAFDVLWARLFTSPIHLDSALAKEPEETRAELASVVPMIMRAPIAEARRAGVRVSVSSGEPWSLASDALARWAPARKLAEALFEAEAQPPDAGLEDHPPHFVEEWRRDFGEERAVELARTLALPPPIALRAAGADVEAI